MSKHKINETRYALSRRGWSNHWALADGGFAGECHGPEGTAFLKWCPNDEKPYAAIRAVVGGRGRSAWITPCPSWGGLIRIARRLMRTWTKEKP